MWLLADRFAREMRARANAGLIVSAEAQREFAASTTAAINGGQPRNLQIADGVAEIAVDGLLTERPDLWAWLMGYGNTTYSDIQQALAIAQMDPAIKRVVLRVNSPGGKVGGLFDTLAALDAFGKPKQTVTSLAASAAYAIAALGGKIEATNAAVEVGSVGVATEMWVYDDLVQIASTDAPNKRPDVTTEEGKAVIRAELDALHELFVDAIARGRGTTAKNVNSSFGRGGLVIAGEAKALGMIDKIQKPALRAVVAPVEPEMPTAAATATPTDASAAIDVAGETPPAAVAPAQSVTPAAAEKQAAKPKGKTMDINTLKTEHPDVYAAALAEGAAQGQAKERDRVSAHLIRGKASGAMDLAVESVESGAEMTETLKAKYDTAGKNAADVVASQAETDVVGAAVDGAAAIPTPKTMADTVVDIICKNHGIEG
jgi:ClpP class serine protease